MGPIGCPETSVAINLPCVTSQKTEDLMYTTAEAWNYAEEEDGEICTVWNLMTPPT